MAQEKHIPLWKTTSPFKVHFPPLSANARADVCVIGGGITGLTTAYLLCRQGLNVALVEAKTLGSGTTGGTTAHLDPLTDLSLSELIENFGVAKAQEIIESGKKAIDFIEETLQQVQADAEFERLSGNYFAEDQAEVEKLEFEYKAAQELGLKSKIVNRPHLPWKALATLQVDGLGQFHPLKYLQALLMECLNLKCLNVYENTRIMDVESGTPCRVISQQGHVIEAQAVVMATHYPLGRMVSIQSRAYPYRSYVLGVRSPQKMPKGLYWDLKEPYHYYRQAQNEHGPLILVGGADHKTGALSDTKKVYSMLEKYVREQMEISAVEFAWSAQYYESADGLPYIGPAPFERNVYIATGYAGTGMAFGTVAAMMLSTQVLGKEVPWEKLYSPSRIRPLASARTFLEENVDAAARMIGDRLKSAPAGTQAIQSLKKREGKVLRLGADKYAVYRDEQDQIHLLSPVCTHMKCHVNWNNAEKSWDCPCHGGRYAPDGSVIWGPPVCGLKKFNYDEHGQSEGQEKAS